MRQHHTRFMSSIFIHTMLLVLIIFFHFIVLGCNKAVAGNTNFSSKITSIRDIHCYEISRPLTAYYDNRQLDADECPAPSGWRFFRVFSLNSFWIDIAYGNSLWSTEKAVLKGLDYANPSIRPDTVEWRMTKNGIVTAAIINITTIDTDTSREVSPIYVFSLINNMPRFCGIAKTKTEARYLADRSNMCKRLLPKVTIPR